MHIAYDQIVAGGAIELDQAQFGLLPADAIGRNGVTDAHLAVLPDVAFGSCLGKRSAIGAAFPLCGRGIGSGDVDYEGVVPALVEVVGAIEDHIGVEVVVADFPGQLFAEQWVLAGFARPPRRYGELIGLRPERGIQQQVSGIDHVPVRPVSAMPRTIYFWPMKKITIMGSDVNTVAAISSPGTGSPWAICQRRKARPMATV